MAPQHKINIELSLSLASMYLDCAKYYLSLRNQITGLNLTICGAIITFFDSDQGVDRLALVFFLTALAVISFILAGRHTIDFIYYWNSFFRLSDAARSTNEPIDDIYTRYACRHEARYKRLNWIMFGATANSHIYLWPALNAIVPLGVAIIILMAEFNTAFF